jgi:hypothetical protein
MANDTFNERISTASDRSILTEGCWWGWAWQRRGGWQRVVAADSLGKAAAALTKVADQLGVRDADTLLTRAGGCPAGLPLGRRK